MRGVDHWVQVIGNGLLVASAVFTTASVIVHARVPWWRSEMGRHLMAYMVAMAAVLDLGVAKLIIGDSPSFQTLRTVVFVGVPLVTSWRLWLQIKAQRSPGRADQ